MQQNSISKGQTAASRRRIDYSKHLLEAHLNLDIHDASLAVIRAKNPQSFTALEVELFQELDKIKNLSVRSVKEESRISHSNSDFF